VAGIGEPPLHYTVLTTYFLLLDELEGTLVIALPRQRPNNLNNDLSEPLSIECESSLRIKRFLAKFKRMYGVLISLA